ncbi:MAG: hypothetical protein IPQ18_07540 [Saprospiraceae bacterium]|nr:hypothetical protein [Saprospiraceae bacterium]
MAHHLPPASVRLFMTLVSTRLVSPMVETIIPILCALGLYADDLLVLYQCNSFHHA